MDSGNNMRNFNTPAVPYWAQTDMEAPSKLLGSEQPLYDTNHVYHYRLFMPQQSVLATVTATRGSHDVKFDLTPADMSERQHKRRRSALTDEFAGNQPVAKRLRSQEASVSDHDSPRLVAAFTPASEHQTQHRAPNFDRLSTAISAQSVSIAEQSRGVARPHSYMQPRSLGPTPMMVTHLSAPILQHSAVSEVPPLPADILENLLTDYPCFEDPTTAQIETFLEAHGTSTTPTVSNYFRDCSAFACAEDSNTPTTDVAQKPVRKPYVLGKTTSVPENARPPLNQIITHKEIAVFAEKWMVLPDVAMRVQRNGVKAGQTATLHLTALGLATDRIQLNRTKQTVKKQHTTGGKLYQNVDSWDVQRARGLGPQDDLTTNSWNKPSGPPPKMQWKDIPLLHFCQHVPFNNWPQGQDRGIMTRVLEFVSLHDLWSATTADWDAIIKLLPFEPGLHSLDHSKNLDLEAAEKYEEVD
ncbi:hypothetical protein Slin14017_G116440 [Septoria linicola]|nr:hypothetical protein Slin14017_G116440 [Septoria linicola]